MGNFYCCGYWFLSTFSGADDYGCYSQNWYHLMSAETTSFPRDVIEQAQLTQDGWEKLRKKLAVPNLTVEEFEKEIKAALKKIETAEKLKEAKSKAIVERNKSLNHVWKLTKRVRNSAKATFGDNSQNLKEFGIKPTGS